MADSRQARPARPGRAAGIAAAAAAAMLAAAPALGAGIADPVALERLVLQDCGSCHGLTLKGGLGPALLAANLDHYAPELLAEVILDGIPGTAMPPWRPLISEEEAAWIARYLKQSETP